MPPRLLRAFPALLIDDCMLFASLSTIAYYMETPICGILSSI